MEEKKLYCNSCTSNDADSTEIMRDKVKMLEISQAIHDLDSKLTDLEIALNINHE